jgi:hypothetical protein
MDLSNYDFDDLGSDLESAPKLEPGIYDLHFAGYQELNGKNNWKALKILFTIGETNRQVGHAFCVEHDNEQNANRGRSSLKKMASAMGVYKIKHPDDFMDKSVRAPLKYDNDNKYLEIDENFGKNWQPVSSEKPAPATTEKKATLDDDEIPF